MTNENELEQVERDIEISIEAARGAVERKDMMEELIADPKFTELFTVGYMERESARLVSLLADNQWQEPEKQKELVDDMRSISGLRQYILNIKAIGRQMENQIVRSESELDELRNEGV